MSINSSSLDFGYILFSSLFRWSHSASIMLKSRISIVCFLSRYTFTAQTVCLWSLSFWKIKHLPRCPTPLAEMTLRCVSQMVADTLFRPPEDWLTTIWTRNIELHLSIRPVASDFKFLCNLAQLGFSPCFPSLKACLPLRPFLRAFVKSRSINWKPRCISDLDTVDKPATYPFSSLHIILKDVLRFGNCLSDAKMQFYVC